MGDVIITVVGLWVFIKILKVIFGGWSKSDYQRKPAYACRSRLA